MTQTPVGMRCPECASQRTRVRYAGSLAGQPTLTYALIAINTVIQLASFVGGAAAVSEGASWLIAHGALSRAAVASGEYWRLLTAGFLHAGLLHLLFNMIALYILGSLLEPAIGKLRFGLIYLTSLLAGSFGALLLSPNGLTVGASGAIFGLMGAGVVIMRNRGISVMESGLGLWIVLNLLLTLAIPGISIGGHIGGLVGGAIAGFVLFELPDRVRLPAAAFATSVVCLATAAVVGSIIVSQSA